jgi:hypothetical protein
MKTSRRSVIAVAVTLVVGTAALAALSANSDTPSRQEEVARRGAIVMPFDLDRTTHIFKPRSDGGVQTVIADDPADRGQVRLVREHLKAEADAFARGDFGDPAKIHGDEMPGLQVLKESYGSIALTFEPTADGARITYRTADPMVIEALHDWFEAQVSDHGSHAEK